MSVYYNGKEMIEMKCMEFVETPEEFEEAYSDPSNHLPSDGLTD
jgi:hypothetical protein